MNSKVYKWCAVPLCKNTSITTPNKVFVHVPIKKEIRVTWLKLAQRNPDELSLTSTLYFCEDHFDLPNDMENYMEYHVMGSVSQVRMKIGCMPKNFTCQPDRTTLTPDTTKRPNKVKIQRMMTQHDCKNHFEEECIVKEQISSKEIVSSSSVQHKVEGVPHLTPRVLDTSIQVKMFKAFKSKANKTQLPNDMANYMRYRIVGTVAQVRMIPGCTPTKFECQPDRKRRSCGGKERPYILKKKRMKAVEECMNKSEIKNTSCSSLLDTSNINCQTVEEHAAEILYKQDEKSFQIVANKAIKEDFDLHESQDDVLNLHTHIDIKQENNEDIDASVPNLSSASSSRTNSACGSPSRESHTETFTEHDPLNTMDVIVMKEEPGSPSSDVSIHSRRDIEMEVAADVYQQHTKKQSQQKIQLTQIRYANAERQRRYRAKIKADKINAYTRFNASSDVQQQTQNIKINRRPQTNVERTRKHRQLLPEKQQQQQMEEMNVITVLSKKNVDPVAHARNTRKRHLSKLRQSRFGDRQRCIPSTSSQQAQELGTQEKYVDDDRHQEALEDLHSSDPSHSTGSCSQTMLTLRKIKKNFDLRESQDDEILKLHTHIDIKQDIEDIDTSVPNLFPASSSITNSACDSPSREIHIETFTQHDPLNTMDVIVMKEEPGSPSSDVSIHLDAADSPEEHAIEIKLRNKMKILSQNEETIKRRREEISILEKSNKELLAEIKYLQNVSKKKC